MALERPRTGVSEQRRCEAGARALAGVAGEVGRRSSLLARASGGRPVSNRAVSGRPARRRAGGL
eukprot:5872485-Alexandrium_andersonii.AAC.1